MSSTTKPDFFQLHWQNTQDLSQTEFVAQFGGATFDEVESRLNEVAQRRRGECPEGWAPLVCNQDSEYFVMAAAPTV